MDIILHSTGCPKCNILKKKLEDKGIDFKENTELNVDELIAKGFTSVPILQVGDKYMEFSEANTWLNNR